MDIARYVRSGWWGTLALRWDNEVLIIQYLFPLGVRGLYLVFPAQPDIGEPETPDEDKG